LPGVILSFSSGTGTVSALPNSSLLEVPTSVSLPLHCYRMRRNAADHIAQTTGVPVAFTPPLPVLLAEVEGRALNHLKRDLCVMGARYAHADCIKYRYARHQHAEGIIVVYTDDGCPTGGVLFPIVPWPFLTFMGPNSRKICNGQYLLNGL
jgi:hypothetical protein